ncbi:MAG: HigA family addiction module antitoxin [Marinobacter sp.]|uniref:HigA family addiction module antitoxin n=1 Tax=Marinobacter sp. TaxID=50741 RepID=UPI00349FF10E
MIKNGMRPIHPGEILREEYLNPLEMSVNALAKELHVTVQRLNEVVRGNRRLNADLALRLGRYFSTTDRFWLNLQMDYDLRVAEIDKAELVEREVKPRPIGHDAAASA